MNRTLTHKAVIFAMMSSFCVASGQQVPEESLTPAPIVKVHVVDAGTGDPIGAFRILKGTPQRRDDELEEEVQVRARWQPHTLIQGGQGVCEWSTERAWERTAIRVEAEGYIPAIHGWITKCEVDQEITIKLEKDPGVEGEVRLPDGKSAVGASVGVALPAREISVEGPQFAPRESADSKDADDQWRIPPVTQTDKAGGFRLASESDPGAVVVAVHPDGYCEMPWVDFQKTKVMKLAPWGKVTGTVMAGQVPSGGDEVTLTSGSMAFADAGVVHGKMTAKTATEGTFSFAYAIPGRVQVSLFDEFPEEDPNLQFLHIPIPKGLYVNVDVALGKVTKVELKKMP